MDKLLLTRGHFCHPSDFAEIHPSELADRKADFFQHFSKILVVGAGGLGCEIVKNLAMMGFVNIHVIDMDTIDPSNLNRQFLFRAPDVGKFKADLAAAFVNKRCPGAKIVAHCMSVQAKDREDPRFYRQFMEDRGGCIILGLDNLEARKWMCAKMCHLSQKSYNDGEKPDQDAYEANQGDTIVSTHMIDGGTEGFTGSVIYSRPGYHACYNCTLVGIFGPSKAVRNWSEKNANKPFNANHCAVYAMNAEQGGWFLHNQERKCKGLQEEQLDYDSPAHIQILTDYAQQHAAKFGIDGVSFEQVQGVVKNIMPAIGATNAAIAAVSCNEAFKYFFKCGRTMQQHIPKPSSWYTRRMGDHPEQPSEPWAPNQFRITANVSGGALWDHNFNAVNEGCDSCWSIESKYAELTISGSTTLRDALPQLAAAILSADDEVLLSYEDYVNALAMKGRCDEFREKVVRQLGKDVAVSVYGGRPFVLRRRTADLLAEAVGVKPNEGGAFVLSIFLGNDEIYTNHEDLENGLTQAERDKFRTNFDKTLRDLFLNLAESRDRIVVDHPAFQGIQRPIIVHLT